MIEGSLIGRQCGARSTHIFNPSQDQAAGHGLESVPAGVPDVAGELEAGGR